MAFKQYEVKVYDGEGSLARIEWKCGGRYHRDNGPAIEFANGEKHWYKEGSLHRENGPAIEKSNGHQEWFKNGKPHRKDGPAVIAADGQHTYYLDGKELSKDEWQWILNEEIEEKSKNIVVFKQKVHELTSSLNGKVAEIEGKKYKLQLVE